MGLIFFILLGRDDHINPGGEEEKVGVGGGSPWKSSGSRWLPAADFQLSRDTPHNETQSAAWAPDLSSPIQGSDWLWRAGGLENSSLLPGLCVQFSCSKFPGSCCFNGFLINL